MKNLIFVFFILLLLSTSIAFSEEIKQDSKVGDALTSETSGTMFKAALKPGFHFNEQAPNLVTVDGKNLKPKVLGKREAKFELPKAEIKDAHASLYVCDDEKTFCEPMMIQIKGGAVVQTTSAGAAPAVIAKAKVNHHGFIEDNLPAAAAQAQKEKKLILVDFAARWCPGCVRLEKEVFETKEFKKTAKDFIKVRLDFDRFENLSLGKKTYGIKFIPTLLVLTPELEEVSRSVDFQPMTTIATFLKDAQTTPLSFAALKEKASAGDKDATLKLGQRFYVAGRFDEAIPYLEKSEPTAIELIDARVQGAQAKLESDPSTKANFQKVTRDAIKAEPASTRSIVWRTLLVESLPEKSEERKTLAAQGVAVADDLLANEKKIPDAMRGDAIGEFTGLEKLLIASQRADLIDSAGLDEATKQEAKIKVTEIGEQLKIPISRTGPAMRHLIFLVSAKQWPKAETQGRALLKRDPKNPELQRRMLRVLNELKKFDEAIRLGREALPESFGKNEVWVAQQLAKAYAGSGKKLEAKALAQSYLARTDIDWAAMKSEQKDLTEVANN